MRFIGVFKEGKLVCKLNEKGLEEVGNNKEIVDKMKHYKGTILKDTYGYFTASNLQYFKGEDYDNSRK